jgi:monoamine oxidase
MLKLSAASAALALAPSAAFAAPKAKARIGIIGGGVAGLTTAHRLAKAGHSPVILEASNRLGGRMMTLPNFYQGMFAELGGELVDTNHEDLRKLCKELRVEVQPLNAGDKGDDLYFFDGKFRSPKDMMNPKAKTGAFRPIAKQIAADSEKLLDKDEEWTDFARELDKVSLEDYLNRLKGKTDDWAIDLLKVAYVGEFGLETADQSSLNIVDFITSDLTKPFEIFGESDEAYRIKGGSSRLIEALAAALKDKADIRLGWALAETRAEDKKPALVFDTAAGAKTETFDYVILALPFTRLRQVNGLDALSFSEDKLRAINELGYGTNAKVLAGTKTRAWREATNAFPAPSNGAFYADLPFQQVWETSRAQPGQAGIITNYLGGKAGEGTEADALAALKSGLEAMSPRLGESLDPNAKASFFWARHPFTLGSYAGARPGQYTTLLDVTAEPEFDGRVHFAGEHTSSDFLGYMNGGVESGNRAAAAVAKLTRRS